MTKFYTDIVQNLDAMAASKSIDPVDKPHFNMWCKIAADELRALRLAYRLLALKHNPAMSHNQITKFLNNIAPIACDKPPHSHTAQIEA
jgi:hypothetical protein